MPPKSAEDQEATAAAEAADESAAMQAKGGHISKEAPGRITFGAMQAGLCKLK